MNAIIDGRIDVWTHALQKTAGICGGRACIAGHRIRVADVVVWHERRGYSADEVVAMFPGLSLGDVHAALAYYFDHRSEIEGGYCGRSCLGCATWQGIFVQAPREARCLRFGSLPISTFPGPVVEGLRRRGIDIVTAQELGRCGVSDPDQLSFAAGELRVLVSFDTDFLALHQAGNPHAGIAWCPALKYSIGELLQGACAPALPSCRPTKCRITLNTCDGRAVDRDQWSRLDYQSTTLPSSRS